MTPTRYTRNISTAAVATIAAWSSWSHMVAVALHFGERPEVAYVLPLSVDGMLVVASTAMVEDKRAGRSVRWSARIAFTAGVAASVAANIAAAEPTLGARIVAAWPAVALLLVVEMLSRTKPPSEGASSAPTAGGVRITSVGNTIADIAEGETDIGMPSPMPRNPEIHHGAGPSAAIRPRRRRSRSGSPGRTADVVARLRAERPEVTAADIAAEVGVSERHVRRILTSES